MRINNEHGCDPGPASRASGERVRVAVVDALAVVREGVRAMLQGFRGIDSVSGFESVEALLRQDPLQRPQVVLLEPRLRGQRLGEALDLLAGRLPAARVLLWYAAISAQETLEATERGVAGFLPKEASAADTAQAIAGALHGPGDAAAARPRPAEGRRQAAEQLTRREFSVLRLLCEGMNNVEIASALNISHGTTKVYMSRVLAKLGAQDRTQAVVLSLRERLVAPPA